VCVANELTDADHVGRDYGKLGGHRLEKRDGHALEEGREAIRVEAREDLGDIASTPEKGDSVEYVEFASKGPQRALQFSVPNDDSPSTRDRPPQPSKGANQKGVVFLRPQSADGPDDPRISREIQASAIPEAVGGRCEAIKLDTVVNGQGAWRDTARCAPIVRCDRRRHSHQGVG
jgi:hypothetical protein